MSANALRSCVGNGLDESISIKWGKRTPYTPKSKLPMFPNAFVRSPDEIDVMTNTSKELYTEVVGEMVFPFSAEKCFALMKDYREFLESHLFGNEKDAKTSVPNFCAAPSWLRCGADGEEGSVGALCEYAFDISGVVYWMVDEVVRLDSSQRDADGNPVYVFEMKTRHDLSKPNMPMEGHGTQMIFSTYHRDDNKCHLIWKRRFLKSKLFGFETTIWLKRKFDGYMQRDIFALWQVYQLMYSEKLPKRDSKVVVIGAGPSGLHMSYLLCKKGLDPKNITILEKSDRYGGKTLSVKDETNVQINKPAFNSPPPRGLAEFADKYSKWETFKDVLQVFFSGSHPSKDQVSLIQRLNTPEALLPKKDYFSGGEEIYHEMGTCYLSPGYYAIRSLLKEIQADMETRADFEHNKVQFQRNGGDKTQSRVWRDLAARDITREVGPDTYAIESSKWSGEKKMLDQWIFYEGRKSLGFFWSLVSGDILKNFGVAAKLASAKLKYCREHEELLGNYYYTLPPKPAEPWELSPDDIRDVWADLLKPFGRYLEDKKMGTLIPLFTYALTAQGYGIIAETPTFLAMQWLTPDLLDGYFEWYYYFLSYKNAAHEEIKDIPEALKKFDNPRKGMLVCGWGGLWDRIVCLYDLSDRIKYNTNVKSISRSKDSVSVEYSLGENESEVKSETFDFLVVAAPLSDPVLDPTIATLNLDFTPEEREIFLNKDVVASTFRTTVFKPDMNGKYSADHLRIFIDEIMNQGKHSRKEAGAGGVFGTRDSYKAIQPRLSTTPGDMYDPTNFVDGGRERMCYQYVAPGKYIEEQDLKRLCEDWLANSPDYVKRKKDESENDFRSRIANEICKKAQSWTYYQHFEGKALRDGKLWDILEIQGQNRTYFVHASTNFESVLDIVNYNNMIFDGLSGRLDNFIPPEADTRPAPWERPQQYLFSRSSIHTWIRLLLNAVLMTLWTIYYVLSYPIMEGYFLKKDRYALQAAFGTPDLGHWSEYSMSKFVNVAPTTRGIIDYRAGKPSGVPDEISDDWDPEVIDPRFGPGDNIFKILQAPKYGFHDKYKNIPDHKTVYASFMWNYTDQRVAIRYWLSTFEDSFMPLLGPWAQGMINWFSYYLPNYYSWFFSWIFASQFRLLIGYSYRFEDEKGGGLYIPDCSMLRTAIKDHGVEMGQRICLSVCKVFTEEVMLTRRLKIDFQPDFVEGAGMGCVIRMANARKHAFSNHSICEIQKDSDLDKLKTADLSW